MTEDFQNLNGAMKIGVCHYNCLVNSQGPYEMAQNLQGPSRERGQLRLDDNLGTSLFKRDLSVDISLPGSPL